MSPEGPSGSGVTEGWIDGVRRVLSPNCDARPAREVSVIVIHGISLPEGHFGSDYVAHLFTNQLDTARVSFADLDGMRVSSHLLLRRDGEIVQFVGFDERAWHAGASTYQGRERCNDFAIGIELEGTDRTPYRDEQYVALVRVCKLLMSAYDIDARDIVGHADIAPGRKTDPGPAFDWKRLKESL